MMDLKEVFKRIKMEGAPPKPDLETLNNLCMAFVSNIPFENLDMFGGKRKIWHLPTIYGEIFLKERGGLCYDINGMLQLVLTELGFKVDLLKAYYYEGACKFSDASDHMAMMVTFGNGEQWLTDVGWGGSCFALPLRMKIGAFQSQPNGIYRVGRIGDLFTVEKKKQAYLKTEEDLIQFESNEEKSTVLSLDGEINEEWNIIYGFSPATCQLDDYQQGYDHARDESKFLNANAIAVLQNPKGRKVLFNNLFYEKEYINPETIRLSRFKKCNLDEIYMILDQEFGIKVDFELNIDFQKCGSSD